MTLKFSYGESSVRIPYAISHYLNKDEWAKDGSLWNACPHISPLRGLITQHNPLLSTVKIVLEPAE